jgi:O-antigen/teichoic acid export membrane protein
MTQVESVDELVDPRVVEAMSSPGPDASSAHESVTGEPRRDEQSSKGGRPHLARSIAVLMGSQLVTWVLTTIVMVVRPRYLGPDGVGQLRLAVSLWMIGSVVIGFGTSTLVTLTMARDTGEGAALLRPSVRLRVGLWAIACLGIVAFGAAVYDPATVAIIAIWAAPVVVLHVGEIARSGLYGLHRMGDTARADVLDKLTMVIVVFGVVLVGGGTPAFAAVSVIPVAVSTIIMWRSLRRAMGPLPLPRRGAYSHVMRRGSPFLLLESTRVAYHQMDVVVISLLATTQELGWYASADALFGSLFFIPSILMTALLPVIAEVHAKRPHELNPLLFRTFRSLMLLAIPVGLGTVIVAEPVCVLLFGEAFRESGAVLAVLGVVVIFEFGNILFGHFAQATGRQAFFNKVMIAATVLSVPLDLVLVPWAHRNLGNGAVGAALAFIVTEIMILSFAIWKLAPGVLDRTTLIRLAKCLAAAAAMFTLAWPLREMFLPVPIVVGAVAYSGVLMLLSTLDREERSALMSLPARVLAWRKARA